MVVATWFLIFVIVVLNFACWSANKTIADQRTKLIEALDQVMDRNEQLTTTQGALSAIQEDYTQVKRELEELVEENNKLTERNARLVRLHEGEKAMREESGKKRAAAVKQVQELDQAVAKLNTQIQKCEEEAVDLRKKTLTIAKEASLLRKELQTERATVISIRLDKEKAEEAFAAAKRDAQYHAERYNTILTKGSQRWATLKELVDPLLAFVECHDCLPATEPAAVGSREAGEACSE